MNTVFFVTLANTVTQALRNLTSLSIVFVPLVHQAITVRLHHNVISVQLDLIQIMGQKRVQHVLKESIVPLPIFLQ